jgi:uncharacterized damage-inducible protein DinB
MDQRLEDLAWLTDQEFQGMSFNSASLVATLRTISPEQAASTDTYEGFSVWRIVLHLAYWKYFMVKILGGNAGEFPYTERNWPEPPDTIDDRTWEETIEYLEEIHVKYIATLDNLDPSKLDEEYTPYETPYWKLITWMASHDLFHGAQIRNMGVPGMKRESAEEVYQGK